MEEKQASDSMGDLLDHEFDGIREYDNPCPGWWKWIFFLTAVFAFFYFFYFQIGRTGISVEKDHKNAVANNIRLRFSEIGELEGDEATLIEYMQKPVWLEVGQSVYDQRCKSCHGPDGQGLVGPNLTDEYYKSVTQLTDVVDVVMNGAGNGSMPAWKRLHPNEIVLVSALVANMRGQNLSGPRVNGDKEIPPWPKEPAAESDGDSTDDTGADSTEEQPADDSAGESSGAGETKTPAKPAAETDES